MHPLRVAFLGTYPPRRCGIAAFTADLAQELALAAPGAKISIVGMNDGQTYAYGDSVRLTIDQDDPASYEAAARSLHADVLCVQHEFGIFGGPAGSYLLTLLRSVRAPIVTTMHTVLERYTPEQYAVVEELAALSSKIVVMSRRAVGFLVSQGVPRHKICFVHHGIPDVPVDREAEKHRMGVSGRSLILTFGLLSPNKGIETAIRALPSVVRRVPDALYLILGATHPHIREQHGEAYREELTRLVADLGMTAHVRFDDEFAELDRITSALAAADVCVIPYLTREQITSGTLAYALGNGKAVVSTPFWHAEELLEHERGILVPFDDPVALGTALGDLLGDPGLRAAMEERARQYGAHMRWPNVARAYLEVFDAARRGRPSSHPQVRLPELTLDHVAALTDGTGLLQHAIVAVPNSFEGYTTDDNARALQLAALAGEVPHAAALSRRTLAFLNYALEPGTRRFHNFMSYDRHWLDQDGGDNAQARAVRALVSAASNLKGALAGTAEEILGRSWGAIESLESPRAKAIALVAIAERHSGEMPGPGLAALGERYAADLLRHYREASSPGWPWFERYLSYSNAKLPHGLIAYGAAFGHARALQTGLAALRWLETQQTGPDGAFLPVGSERVYRAGEARPLWDGQPIEVYATVAAVMEAHRATGDAAWLGSARRALEWLVGRNALGQSLHDPVTGGCRDGLHRDRLNANQGAESTLALWLGIAEFDRARLAVAPRAIRG